MYCGGRIVQMLNTICNRYKRKCFHDIVANTLFVFLLIYGGIYFYTFNSIPDETAKLAPLKIESQKSNKLYYSFLTEDGRNIKDTKLVWPSYTKAMHNNELDNLQVKYDSFFPENNSVLEVSGVGDLAKSSASVLCFFVAAITILLPWVGTHYLAAVISAGVAGYLIHLTGILDLIELLPLTAAGFYLLFKGRRLKRVGKKCYGTVTYVTKWEEGYESPYQEVGFSYKAPSSDEIHHGAKSYAINKKIHSGDKITILYDPNAPSHHTVIT